MSGTLDMILYDYLCEDEREWRVYYDRDPAIRARTTSDGFEPGEPERIDVEMAVCDETEETVEGDEVEERFGDLRARIVRELDAVSESELGAMYDDYREDERRRRRELHIDD